MTALMVFPQRPDEQDGSELEKSHEEKRRTT